MGSRAWRVRGNPSRRWLPTAVAALLCAVVLTGVLVASASRPNSLRSGHTQVDGGTKMVIGPTRGGAARAQGASGSATVATTSGYLRPETSIAQGIYEFGTNSGVDATDSDLAGTTLTFQWSQLEPAAGTFDWTRVSQAIAPWATAGKHVILRVSTAGQASWGGAAANATPQWVYAQGAPAVHDDGATLPVYWNATFLQDYDAFIEAFAAQFNGDPALSFIEIGVGDGGETLPDTQEGPGNRYALWSAQGYSDAVWLDTIENIATTYREDFPSTPVVPLVDSSFLGPSQGQDYAKLTTWFVTTGFPMQYDGLTSNSAAPNAYWGQTPTIMEQRNPTSSSGDTLAGDCTEATGPRESKVILIYQSDIDSPANLPALRNCAQAVAP